jgi:putative ribosome biogenesis GTPase RsgA
MAALVSLNSTASPNRERGETRMSAHVGDRIVVESERASQPSRAGVIEEVLREDSSRVRVRWEDGHTSILTPSAGVARITPQKTRTKS